MTVTGSPFDFQEFMKKRQKGGKLFCKTYSLWTGVYSYPYMIGGTDGIGVAGKLLAGPSLDHETVFSLSQSAKQVAW